MKTSERYSYASFARDIDVDAFEAAIGFDPTDQRQSKHGSLMDIGQCPDPWHQHKNGDTTGKFAIIRDSRSYNCFVCGSGSLLDLAMALNGTEEQEAETWLYQFAKPIEPSDTDFLSEIDAILHQERREKPVLPFYNEHVLGKWTGDLAPIDGWLKDRGISDAVAAEARLGYQANAKRLARYKTGAAPREPYMGRCVYFPHFWGERLVGWQQRWLDDDRPSWVQKYTNTSGFPKTETIYNYERVWLSERPIIVCESVPTVLFLWSLGYPAVAVFGGSISDEQMRLLRLFQQGVVLAPDNDEPGRKWTAYSEAEKLKMRGGRKPDRVILAEYLSRYIPVQVGDAVGEYDSGNDWGDLLSEGPPFAASAVRMLYEDAEYY